MKKPAIKQSWSVIWLIYNYRKYKSNYFILIDRRPVADSRLGQGEGGLRNLRGHNKKTLEVIGDISIVLMVLSPYAHYILCCTF